MKKTFVLCLSGWMLVFNQGEATSPTSQTAVVKLSKRDCRKIIVNHRPDKSVAYKGGVNVKGKSVAPADLSPSQDYHIPENITIDLKAPISSFTSADTGFSERTQEFLKGSDLHTGTVLIKKNGDVTINGQEVNSEAKDKMVQACRQAFPRL